MLETRKDLLFSVNMLIVGLLCTAVSFAYPPDSSGFPRAISLLLLILSTVLLFRTISAHRKLSAESSSATTVDDGTTSRNRAAIIVFLSAPAYILLARLFDFEIATFIYLLGGMLVLGFRKPVSAVLISVFLLVLVKLLFFTLLDVYRAPTLLFAG